MARRSGLTGRPAAPDVLTAQNRCCQNQNIPRQCGADPCGTAHQCKDCTFLEKSQNFFGYFWILKKMSYLCVPKQSARVVRELSSVGSERLPYKQRVGGSTPSAPTKDQAVAEMQLLFSYADSRLFWWLKCTLCKQMCKPFYHAACSRCKRKEGCVG